MIYSKQSVQQLATRQYIPTGRPSKTLEEMSNQSKGSENQHLKDMESPRPPSPGRPSYYQLMTGRNRNSPCRICLRTNNRCIPPRDMIPSQLRKILPRRQQLSQQHLQHHLPEDGRHWSEPWKEDISSTSTWTQSFIPNKMRTKERNTMWQCTKIIITYRKIWRIHWINCPAQTLTPCNLIKLWGSLTARSF